MNLQNGDFWACALRVPQAGCVESIYVDCYNSVAINNMLRKQWQPNEHMTCQEYH